MIHLLDLPQSGVGLALVRALGWTLLHFCWQGVVIAAALWCVLGMIGARFSQARYAAACVALALMVALPAATLLRLAKSELAANRAMATLALVFDVTAVDDGNAPPVPLKERAKEALERAVPWVPAVWMAGVVLFLGRLSLGVAAVRRMRSVVAEPMPETYEEVFREMARRLGVARAVELMHSAVVEVPTVIGWLRPMVLVPVGCFTGLSPVQIEALLAHELAHIRRHDYLVSVCQSVVEALLFYHPAVWWVSRQVRRERECCCDELAIAATGDVLAYARALSWLEQQRSAMPEIALGANGGVLTMRIRRMLGYREGPVVSLPVVATVTLVVLAAVGAYFGEVAHAQRKAAMTNAQVPLVETTAEVSSLLQPVPRVAVPRFYAYNEGRRMAKDAAPENAAQTQAAGTLEGTVVDATGAVVPRATVTATETSTGTQVSFTTDNTGKFSFAALPPAVYSIDVVARGFQRMHQENVRVGGDAVTLGLKLSVGAATESLTVHPQKGGSSSAATGPSTGPMLVSSGVMAQQATFQPAPAYPPIAKAAHVQGAVVLRAIVSPEGAVQHLQVISGAPMLTSSALDAVKTWTYKPYLLNGRPVTVDTIITVHYTLPPESAATADDPGAAAAVRPHGPVRVSSGVAAGMAISQPAPMYPEEAKAEHVQGVVVLHAVISKGGEVENLQVVSGPKELVASAIDAVSQWRYNPYLLNGEPTEVETTINVNYTLADDSQPQAGGPSGQAPNPAARVPVRSVFVPKRAAPVLASFVPPPSAKGTAEEIPTDAAGNPLRRIGGNVIAPVPIYEVEPEFTQEARAAKVGAVVVVALVVNQDGRPENVHVVRGELDDKRTDASILAGLEGKALEAVQQYRFRPAMENGQPVPVSLNIEVNLKMF